MNMNVKKTTKFAVGVCAALGVVAVSAIAASGAAIKVVAEGLKTATNTMKETLAEVQSTGKNDSTAVEPETPPTAEADVEITPADFAESPSDASEN